MARQLSTRLTITGTLKAVMPLHIGGMPDSREEDMPLAKNGLGEFYVPGTSLAGVFRDWMEKHFDNKQVLNNLWGFQPPKEERKTEKKPEGAASRIFIEDAKVTLPAGLSEELWDSVGIERRWGTAAEGKKFDRTVLPKGSTFELSLQVDLPIEIKQANTMRAMLGYLLQALAAGQLVLGAATTRGLGQVKLINPQLQEVDWTRKISLLQWLSGDTKIDKLDYSGLIAADKTLKCHPPEILHITIDWTPTGSLMTKASYEGVAVDMLPRISGIEPGKITLVLPGSSLKGALRNQAERIIRTVLGNGEIAEDWLTQVQVPLVEYIFGSAKQASENTEESKTLPAPGRGCLSINTCYATNAQCTTQQWQEIEAAKTSENNQHFLYDALKEANLRQTDLPKAPNFGQGFHVGIDRWTGGAAEGFLYSAIEPSNVEWEPIEMRLDLSKIRLPCELQNAALVLLLLLLRDLSEQRLPIGFGVNRGYGNLKVNKVNFQWEKMGEINQQHWLNDLSLQSPFSLNQLPETEMKQLQSDWQNWIEECTYGC